MTDPRVARHTLRSMNKQTFVAIVIVLAILSAIPLAGARQGVDLFQKALAVERADGDLRQAIRLYEQVVKENAGDRALVARALLRIAECQEKLGQRDAAKVYERIVREFADQADTVIVARTRLAGLQNPTSSAALAVRTIWSGEGVDPMGSASTGSQLLSFTDWSTGDLAVRDLVAGTTRRLTGQAGLGGWEGSADFAENSVLSPDGRQVVYAWFNDRGNQPKAACACRFDLRITQVSGPDAGKPRVLLASTSRDFWARPVAWMPDGKSVAIVRDAKDKQELGILNLADSSVRVLITYPAVSGPERVSVSPDGRFLALDLETGGGVVTRDIVIVSVADGKQSAVRHSAHDRSPVMAGTQLLFISDRTGADAIWRMPISNGAPAGSPVLVTTLTPGARLLGTTASGAVLVWSGGVHSNIYQADLTGTLEARGRAELAVDRFLNANSAPSMSPDGKLLAYRSQRSATPNGGGGAILIHSRADGQDRVVPFALAPAESGSWFPDGRSLLVAVRDTEERRLNYFKVDIATGNHERVMSTRAFGIPMRRPLVSPDGQAVFYVDREATGVGSSYLRRHDLRTGADTQLKSLTGDNYFNSFAISPDGSQIAYFRSGGETVLEVMPSNGGEPKALYRGGNSGQSRWSGLAWSRDGRQILFVKQPETGGSRQSDLWRVSPADGATAPIGITMPGMIRFPSIDPEGSRIVFAVGSDVESTITSVENYLPRQ